MQGPDYKQAYFWCAQSANQKYAEALYRQGRFYEGWRFVEKSVNQAVYHIYEALEREYPEAFTALGAPYNNPEFSGSTLATAKMPSKKKPTS